MGTVGVDPGVLVTIVSGVIGYTVWLIRLEGRVNEAHKRSETIEKEMESLKSIDVRVARLETKVDGVVDQLRDLAASLRWMQHPAPYEPPSGQMPPRARGD